jgi:hypothetical protein
MKKNTMRRAIIFTMVMAIMMMWVPAMNVSAATQGCFQSEGLKYKIIKDKKNKNTNNVMVLGFAKGCKNQDTVNIPETVTCNNKTYNVTKVKNGAFNNNQNIQEVSIPDSVKNIGANSFKGCTNLSDLLINNSNAVLGANSFSNCNKIILSNCIAQ